MIFLYILLSIVALLFAASLIPIRVYFSAGNDFALKIRFLFLKFNLLPLKQKEETEKNEIKKENQKLVGKGGIFDNLNEILLLLKILFFKVLWIIRKTRINKLDFYVTVASDDAAKTGVEYGAVCSLVYPAFGFLGTLTDISSTNVEVKADFDTEDSSFYLDSEISIKLGFAFVAACSAFWQYVKFKYLKSEYQIQKEGKK